MIVQKRTKVVCTIGPATWDPEVMKQIIEAGMDCARVNGAFADIAELDKVKKLVKDVSEDVSLMVDVKGPEIRLNKFPEPIKLEPGMEIKVGNDSNSEIYPANYNDIYKIIKPGQRVVIGDGDVEFTVDRIEGTDMYWKVVYGEVFKPGKAMNIPGAEYTTTVLTEKDKENLMHAINTGWDFVSASFIQNAESAKFIRNFMGDTKMKLIAKIEDQQGVNNIDEILENVDGIMIARGGLGVELGLENVPMAQRLLIEKAKGAGKIVITATQMLESMTTNPRPTRAEINDVATAILLGTDAVMLSAESSAGKYPVEAVKTITKTAIEIEKSICPEVISARAKSVSATADAITKAAAEVCKGLENEISKVIVITKTGGVARLLSRYCVKQPIHVLTSEEMYRRQILLSRNITSANIQLPWGSSRDEAMKIILTQVKKLNLAEIGEKILVLSKTPNDQTEYFPNIFEIVEVR